MNQLSRAERAQIIRALVEGNSIRSVARMTGFARNTISTLLVQIGPSSLRVPAPNAGQPANDADRM
jgi:transposase